MSIGDRAKLMMSCIVLGPNHQALIRVGGDVKTLWCRGLTADQIIAVADRMRAA
ncbi:MAG: hypothetical protein ACRYG8_27520 [Janthinobacterium lividum]